MFYIIYKTTNTINGKIYIGLHETDNLSDGYLGSGKALKRAIRKYGKDNFKKEILFVYNNKREMIAKEKELVNEDFVNRKDTYNISKGGFGLSTLSESKRKETDEKIKEARKKWDLTEMARKRIATQLKNDKNCFKKIGEKSAKKIKENYKNGYTNPRQNFNKVQIYDNENKLFLECYRINLPMECTKYKLPERALIKSLHNKGSKIYQSNYRKCNFSGWYAVYENEKI